MTFLNTEGETNLYLWFEYESQTICYQTLGKVSVSMNVDPINANKNKQSTIIESKIKLKSNVI